MNREMLDAACDGIEAAIRLSTVGIVVGSGDRKGQDIGTGTLICWRGRHLILTAEHVIAGTPAKDIRIILPPDSPPVKVERDTLLNLPGMLTKNIREPVELKLGQLVADAKLDLAAMQVDSGIAEKYPLRFFNLAMGGRTPGEGRQTTIIGFPYDISLVTTNDRRVISTSVEWTRIAPNRERHPGFDPDIHFLAVYTEAEDYPDAKPLGMSGGAMWFLRDEMSQVDGTEGLWYPKIDIDGVGISWHQKTKLLMMVRREAVEEFLTAVEILIKA